MLKRIFPSSHIKTCKPVRVFNEVPSINLSNPNAKTLIVEACGEVGFFKLTNHGVPMDIATKLENEALKFFNLTQAQKDRAPNCLGYGNKRNGDKGWVEYLLLLTYELTHSNSISEEVSQVLQNALRDYHSTIKSLTCEVLKLIAQGLNIEQDVIANFIKERKSDCLLRVNHYPPCSYMRESRGENLLSFGEHTDPQIISLLWSNNTSGLEICLKDGSWVSVPSDPSSIFVAVGDCLQLMTNGRFQSVKHRVATNGLSSRVSIIYFGGPSLPRTIAPLPKLLEMGEKTLYKKFTWED